MISAIRVPNQHPPNFQIAFVGEAPGSTEEGNNLDRIIAPFIGEAGNVLTHCLGRMGVQRQSVFIGNLSNYRPQDNRFDHLLGSRQLEAGLEELRSCLSRVKPNVIAALGAWPMYYLTGKQGKKPGTGILNWRGSILPCTLAGLEGIKVIPTLHPAYVVRDKSNYPVFDADVQRIVADSTFPELKLPTREKVILNGSSRDKYEHYTKILLNAPIISVDIETFGANLACVGFSASPDLGICFVWDTEFITTDSISRILSAPNKKVFHYGTFDTEYLHLKGFEVANYQHDTMVMQHILAPELPRALKFITSIYTREPYYKDEGKEAFSDKKNWGTKTNKDKLWEYNAKDCMVTLECYQKMLPEIAENENHQRIYNFEMEEVVTTARHISRTGLLRDPERKGLIEAAVAMELVKNQSILNQLTGSEINVNSNPVTQTLLYEVLKLPVKRHRDGGITADNDALVSLLSHCKEKIQGLKTDSARKEWQRKFLIIKMIGLCRGGRKLLSSYILPPASDDGRVRSIYSIMGTETGRWSATKYIDGTGLNSQTFPREPQEVPNDLIEHKESFKLPPEILLSADGLGDESESDSDSD